MSRRSIEQAENAKHGGLMNNSYSQQSIEGPIRNGNIYVDGKAYGLQDVQLVSVRLVPKYPALAVAAIIGFFISIATAIYVDGTGSPASEPLILLTVSGCVLGALSTALYRVLNSKTQPQFAVYLLKSWGWTSINSPTAHREEMEQLAQSIALLIHKMRMMLPASGRAQFYNYRDDVILVGNSVQFLDDHLISGGQEYPFGDTGKVFRMANSNPHFVKLWAVAVSVFGPYLFALITLAFFVGVPVVMFGNGLLIGFGALAACFVYLNMNLRGVWAVILVGPDGARCVYKSESMAEAEELVGQVKRVLASRELR
jgi:hypothetical protein